MSKQLKSFVVTSQRLVKLPFTGSWADRLVKRSINNNEVVARFLVAVKDVYQDHGMYLIVKMLTDKKV